MKRCHPKDAGMSPLTVIVAGQVRCMGESIMQAVFDHKIGKVRALVATSKDRNPSLPDVPTMTEVGVKGFEVVGFHGFLAPAGLFKNITAKLSDSLKQIMTSRDVRTRIAMHGTDPAFCVAINLRNFWPARCRAGRRLLKGLPPN